MIFSLFSQVIGGLIYLALHATSTGSFPKPLTSKEEQLYIERLEQGDMLAREKLIEHNLRLVAHITKKYNDGPIEQDDLISIGTIGLIKAVSTFNSKKGIKLATYAARCIENEVLMCLRSLKKSAQDVFISDPIDTDKEGNTLTLLDVISDDSSIVEDIDLKIKREKLGGYMHDALTPRESRILTLRYGLYGGEELTQCEVAKRMGISRSYVSRIEKKALEKLRRRFDQPTETRLPQKTTTEN